MSAIFLSSSLCMKYSFIVLAVLLLLAGCATLDGRSSIHTRNTERITVAAGFYPLTHFAKQVAGDLADIHQVLPAGADPHHYEPSPREMTLLTEADVVLLNGADLMGWEERITALPELQDAVVVIMADHVPLRSMLHDDHDEEGEHESEYQVEHENSSDHEQRIHDPHFWLDPMIAMKEVALIRDALKQADPANAEAYDRNAAAYVQELSSLDTDFRSGLQGCALDTIIVGHDSFGYTGERYGFHSLAIADVHGGELSARAIADITDAMNDLGIKHVFVETLTSPKLSETVARETGAQTLTLDTVHGLAEDTAKDSGYIVLMRGNLRNIRTALQCP